MSLLCKLFGHSKKIIKSHDKDMFGLEYVWQRKYCARCRKRVK